jgi:flagellar biogenesis protein FliO
VNAMRSFFAAILLIPSLAWAGEGVLGTKSGSGVAAASNTGTPGLMSLIQMLFAVGIVMVILKFALPKLMGKMGSGLATKLNGGIQIEESANFAGGSLYVVTVRNKSLLLGVSGTNINCLADLGTATKPDPGPTFQEFVEESAGDLQRSVAMAKAVVTVEEEVEVKDQTDPQEALKRLARLMG